MLIVAHRGASKRAPGNTLPAFELAWKQGADAIEGDFRLTKDGHVVCIHDETIKRTAGADLNVAQSTLSELRKLDVGAWFDPAFKGDSHFNAGGNFGNRASRRKNIYRNQIRRGDHSGFTDRDKELGSRR